MFLISNEIVGQKVILIDIETKNKIANANLSSSMGKGTISDKNGLADLNIFRQNDEIIIQHISYTPKKIIKREVLDTIFLLKNKYLLNTVDFEDVKVPLIEGVSKLSIINRREIEKLKSKSIAELLKQSSGIHVQESQSGGGSPNFRGMEANRLLTVVDGIPLNNAIYRSGHVQSSNVVNSFFIDEIKVATGPSAVVYGDGAMGGAVVVNTVGGKSFGLSSNILEQKHESSSSSSSIKYLSKIKKNRFTLINGFALENSGNLKMGNKRRHGYESWGNEKIITLNNEQLETDYKKYDLLQKTYFNVKDLSINLNNQFSGISQISRFDKLNDYDDEANKYSQWYYGPKTRFAQSITIKKKKKSKLFDNVSIIGAWQKTNESRHKQKRTDTLMSNRYEDVVIFDGILDAKKNINNIDINYGSHFRKQFVTSRANLSSTQGENFYNTTRYPSGGSDISDLSFYFQVKAKFRTGTTIFLGERYNINSLNAVFNDNTLINLPFPQINTNNQSLVSSIFLNQKIKGQFAIAGSYYMGFRNPNIDDIGKIFSKNDNDVIIPNESLKPEKTNNFEYGITYNDKNLSFEVLYFETYIRDAIQRNYSSLNGQDSIIYDGEIMRVQMNQNIQKAKINGFNFAFSAKNLNNYNLNIVYNYLKGRDNLDLPLAHIPPANIKLDLNKTFDNAEVGISYIYNSWKYANEYDENGVDNLDEGTIDGNPSWNIINLNYINHINDNISASFSVENLLDTHYKTFGSGISASGRNFVVSLTSKF